jgi:hypothetical protein
MADDREGNNISVVPLNVEGVFLGVKCIKHLLTDPSDRRAKRLNGLFGKGGLHCSMEPVVDGSICLEDALEHQAEPGVSKQAPHVLGVASRKGTRMLDLFNIFVA